MARNIEIKAHAPDFQEKSRIAHALSGAAPKVIKQEDVFFNVPRGRLKLRFFSPSAGELIFYERQDQEGPKLSDYSIYRSTEPQVLKNVLATAYGIRGIVRKTRDLYMVGRTRIHLDQVEELGEFVELEVVLEPGEELAAGEREAKELMAKLKILPEHLLQNAYIDLLPTS